MQWSVSQYIFRRLVGAPKGCVGRQKINRLGMNTIKRIKDGCVCLLSQLTAQIRTIRDYLGTR